MKLININKYLRFPQLDTQILENGSANKGEVQAVTQDPAYKYPGF